MQHGLLTLKQIKTTSLILVVFATLLLILDIVHIKRVDDTEIGLWDFLPNTLRQAVFLAYPFVLLTSYFLFIVARKVKTKLDFISNILYLLNGVVILLLLVIYLTELVKHL